MASVLWTEGGVTGDGLGLDAWWYEPAYKAVSGTYLKTAKAVGLTIPPSLLQRADRVIE